VPKLDEISSSRGHQKLQHFDVKKHGKAVEYLLMLTLTLQLNGIARVFWGVYLLTLLPPEVLRLVMSQLGLPMDAIPTPVICTWDSVSTALKKVCCASEESDQGILYAIMRYTSPSELKDRFKKVIEDLEQLFLKLSEPLTTQVKIFFICYKIPADYRARFQFKTDSCGLPSRSSRPITSPKHPSWRLRWLARTRARTPTQVWQAVNWQALQAHEVQHHRHPYSWQQRGLPAILLPWPQVRGLRQLRPSPVLQDQGWQVHVPPEGEWRC
jgi:hypothetical protein